ncbi:hypothetical protein F4778DRAFT_783807 [Xylariomycetidae sp. FL2044]|nr:hypothetical protein F4778DRAFT_783807 [Xylariomycetidae sp. FL2044]
MPYRFHRYDDTDYDPGWPRYYITYDHHTDCALCHEPNGLLRILTNLLGGPRRRCRHHARDRERRFWHRGWGGGIKGLIRRRGCHNPDHWAVDFQPHVNVDELPGRINGVRTRVPARCRCRTHDTWGYYYYPWQQQQQQHHHHQQEQEQWSQENHHAPSPSLRYYEPPQDQDNWYDNEQYYDDEPVYHRYHHRPYFEVHSDPPGVNRWAGPYYGDDGGGGDGGQQGGGLRRTIVRPDMRLRWGPVEYVQPYVEEVSDHSSHSGSDVGGHPQVVSGDGDGGGDGDGDGDGGARDGAGDGGGDGVEPPDATDGHV